MSSRAIISTDATGMSSLHTGNLNIGVLVSATGTTTATSNLIGGPTAGARNVISGLTSDGVPALMLVRQVMQQHPSKAITLAVADGRDGARKRLRRWRGCLRRDQRFDYGDFIRKQRRSWPLRRLSL